MIILDDGTSYSSEFQVERVDHWPSQLVFSSGCCYSDGGTRCLVADLSESVSLTICQTPVDCLLFEHNGGLFGVTERDKSKNTIRNYGVVARSPFQLQLAELLQGALIENENLHELRDRFLSHMNSDRYVELAKQFEEWKKNQETREDDPE